MPRQSSNPVFTRSTPLHESLRGTGYAAPTADQVAGIYAAPQRMTWDDIVVKTGLLLGIAVTTGAFAWVALPFGVAIIAALIGFGLAMVNIFKKQVSPPLVLAYAAFMGVALGGISRYYNDVFGNGIVVQAVVGTTAVFGAVLWGYRSGKLQATPQFRKIVMTAFVGLFAVVLLNFVVGIFSSGDPLGIRGGNPALSILFSLAFITVGALTFVLDFDQADRMIASGVDTRESWRVSFGLVVGLVWLYLEILRLLSYLQGRD